MNQTWKNSEAIFFKYQFTFVTLLKSTGTEKQQEF